MVRELAGLVRGLVAVSCARYPPRTRAGPWAVGLKLARPGPWSVAWWPCLFVKWPFAKHTNKQTTRSAQLAPWPVARDTRSTRGGRVPARMLDPARPAARAARTMARGESREGFSPISDKYLPVKSESVSGC